MISQTALLFPLHNSRTIQKPLHTPLLTRCALVVFFRASWYATQTLRQFRDWPCLGQGCTHTSFGLKKQVSFGMPWHLHPQLAKRLFALLVHRACPMSHLLRQEQSSWTPFGQPARIQGLSASDNLTGHFYRTSHCVRTRRSIAASAQQFLHRIPPISILYLFQNMNSRDKCSFDVTCCAVVRRQHVSPFVYPSIYLTYLQFKLWKYTGSWEMQAVVATKTTQNLWTNTF